LLDLLLKPSQMLLDFSSISGQARSRARYDRLGDGTIVDGVARFAHALLQQTDVVAHGWPVGGAGPEDESDVSPWT